MKVLICGSRSIKDPEVVPRAVQASGFQPITEIVTGGASGVDTLADGWAHAVELDRTIMFANWKARGKAAGYHRNERMVRYADVVIAIWDGKSTGTAHTMQIARIQGKPCYVFMVEPKKEKRNGLTGSGRNGKTEHLGDVANTGDSD
jgi:hypothetical protein